MNDPGSRDDDLSPVSERGFRMGLDRRKNPPNVPWLVEWTLLAWVRTSVAVMAFGALLVRFGFFTGMGSDRSGDTLVGIVLLATGAAICVGAVFRYVASTRAFLRGEKVAPSMSLPVAGALVVAGAAIFLIVLLWPTLRR